jgi:hypothetical protein
MEADMRIACFTLVLLLSAAARADPPADKAERKAPHQAGKIVIKKKDANGNWQTERECPLMFANNRKADKPKEKPK